MSRLTLFLSALFVASPLLAADDEAFFFGFLPTWLDTLLSMAAIILVPVVVIVIFVGMWRKVFGLLWYILSLQPLRRWLLRRKLRDDLDYYRDLPAGGDLKIANAVMNSLSSAPFADYQGLFGALILRLIDKGSLLMEVKATMYGTEPHPVLTIAPFPAKAQATDLERQFHDLLNNAAGADHILQPRELQQFLRKDKRKKEQEREKEIAQKVRDSIYQDEGAPLDLPTEKIINDFFALLQRLTPEEKAIARQPDTARQVMGLRKFLIDFSLIETRSISEMPLWKEYLVYATLFGIADQVSRNFGELYSDYFQANTLALTQLNVIGNNALVSFTSIMAKSADQ